MICPYIELCCKHFSGHPALSRFTDGRYLLGGQLRKVMAFSPWHRMVRLQPSTSRATPLHHVTAVVGIGSLVEMLRVHAVGYIARMQHQLRRPVTFRKVKGPSVRKDMDVAPVTFRAKHGIAFPINLRSILQPTAALSHCCSQPKHRRHFDCDDGWMGIGLPRHDGGFLKFCEQNQYGNEVIQWEV